MSRALALAALLGLAAPAAAQAQAAPAAAPNPASLAAARALMQVIDIKGQTHNVIPGIAQGAAAEMQRSFGRNPIPDGLKQQFAAALQSYLGSFDEIFTPTLIDQIAMIYARHFSAAELTRLTALMKDPVMVRFRAENGAIAREMMPLIAGALRPKQEAFQARMRQIVADWIRAHPEDKAKLAPAAPPPPPPAK